MRYTVVRDTREKDGWTFSETANCAGTVQIGLKTGDYSLRGLEKIFSIERKGSTGEFARNVLEKRFEKELERLDKYDHPFMILEFDLNDIMLFPENSSIPKNLWSKLRVSKWFILKRLLDLQLRYKTKIILAGTYGREVAASLFKRMVEMYGCEETDERTTSSPRIIPG